MPRSVPLVVFCLLFPAHLSAQSTAEIRGIVQDETGAVIPGVTVTSINEATGLERTTVSDTGGRYNFPRLPVGTYRVEAELQGFKKFATSAFRLDVEDIRQVNVVMTATGASPTPIGGIASSRHLCGSCRRRRMARRRPCSAAGSSTAS